MHVKSGKYITVVPDQLARDERENIRTCLTFGGNPFSWLQLLPRYKIDREGDRILSATEAYLKVSERPNEYVHCADKDPVVGVGLVNYREINCSLENTSWRLNKFQSSTSLMDKNVLLPGQLVSIQEPESQSHVSVFSKLQSVQTSPPNQMESENSVISFKMATSGDVVFLPEDEECFNSNILWVIESKALTTGGPIAWKSEPIRFRHFNTGVYLAMELTDDDTTHMVTSSVSSVTGTLFNVYEQNSTSQTLTNAKAVQFNQGPFWVQRGEVDATGSYECKGTRDKSQAINLLIHRYCPGEEADEEDEEESMKAKETFDVYVGMSARAYMLRYLDRTIIPDTPVWAVSTIWPGADPSEMGMFHLTCAKIINFLKGFPVNADAEQLQEKPDTSLRSARQVIAREQGLLQILMHLLDVLAPVSAKEIVDPKPAARSPNKKIKEVDEETVNQSDDEKAFIRMGQLMLKEVLSILICVIEQDIHNQLMVADQMPILLAHVGPQPLAAKCVTEMLDKNIKLQETKIGKREIDIFTNKLRSSQMNSMYLNLLKATCSCEKKGVVNNQCTVAEVLFSDMNDVIIQIVPDFTHSRRIEWYDTPSSLYIPETPDSSAPMLGSDLVYKGVPLLSLSWTSKSIDCSPLGLFGKLAIGVEDLYNTVSPLSDDSFGDSYFPSKESETARRRAAVADYFIAQLYLAAELCLDRNYIAMAKLESVFPYEILMALIKIDGGGESVKAAAVKLLMCLHVDRDPQNASQVPCLSRCWSDVAKHEVPALPHVEHIRHLEFALLQQYISDHLRAMSGVRWTSLSYQVVCLLNQLVQFNFYGNVEVLNDVIRPLIQALDRRKMKVSQKVVPSSKSLKRSQSRRGKSMRSKSMGSIPISPSVDSASVAEGGSVENSEDKVDFAGNVVDESTWQYKMLNILESLAALGFILLLVFIAIAVAIYEAVETTTPELEIFGLVITMIFVLELLSRGYCHRYVRGDVYMVAFVSNWLNVIDIVVVLIDLIILGLPDTGGGTGFTKALRAARLVRLVRVLKAARIVSNLTSSEEGDEEEEYKHPVRFLKTPDIEIDTMVESMNILNYVQKLIEDRNLSLLLRAFMLWENGKEKRSPALIFECVAEKFSEFSLGEESVDDIFIDLIMYQSSELVQVVLDVLVGYHSTRYTLMRNFDNMQLLVSPESERQFRYIDQMLLQLERNAETHELWGRLQTQDDIQKNRQTKDYLSELVDLCRTRSTVLIFHTDYVPVKDVQDMLRNFGFYDIIFKVLNLVSTIKQDVDGTFPAGLEKEHENTRDLVFRANELMYWFLLDNPLNQDQIFEELDFFLNSLDRNINSHNVVKAIFSNNEKLMHLVQNSLIEDFAEKICKSGRRPQYLSLIGAILNVGEKNMLENQFDTVKHLIAPARLKKICQYICPVDHAEYQQKVEQMKPFLDKKDVSVDDLPEELHYHLAFIDVLSGCTVGRVNVTTVEAKVQSVYSYVDILNAMIDPRSLLLVNIGLGVFLFNSFIETEMMVGGLESSAAMWKYIKSTIPIFQTAPEELKYVDNNGWFSDKVSRQKIEYIVVCVMCIEGFFARYYDANVMNSDEAGLGNDVVQMSTDDVQSVLSSLAEAFAAMHECRPKCLSEEHRTLILHAAEALHRCMGAEYVDVAPEEPSTVVAESIEGDDEDSISVKLREFIEEISADESTQENAKAESIPFISRIEKLPFIKDDIKEGGDVRYEPFIRKLVSHVRQRFQMIDGEKFLDARCTKTTTWLIKAFRTMIENRWGMSIDERDEDGGEEQDIASAQVVNALNVNGATVLCLELVCVGIDSELMLEAVKLCVAMLFREGGSLAVQETIYNYLSKNDSTLFFKQLRLTMQKLISWHKWNGVIVLPEGEDPDLPDDVIVVRFMQLMCEGHYLNNQDILREQPENDTSINLLDDYVSYLNTVSRIQCRTSTDAASRVASTILEVIQGPCVDTQEYFVLNTELIETLNRIMRSKVVLDCVPEEELELKKAAIDILQGLLEGQGKKKTVYERVLSVIHIDIIQMMSKPDDSGDAGGEQSEEAIVLQSECLVFLQMLCDYRPSLRTDLGYDKADVKVDGAEVACVEVMWNGELQRRFFRVPEICKYLAKSSKDDLVENVDRSNQENKLIDFVERAHNLYKEIKHQEKLVEIGVSAIFSRTNQDMATWTAFFLACIINMMLLCFYVLDGDKPMMPSGAKLAVDVLNVIQIFFAAFTLVLFIVVRVPVQFDINASSEESLAKAVFLTALDPLTVYYVVYLIISILGVFSSDLFSTFLLLDIVMKNSTTRDVLNAVVYPRKQLGMTVILGIFVAYIFTFVVFLYYRDDWLEDYPESCPNLWSCMKVVTGYGLRMGGGIGDMMSHTVDLRWAVDMLYYVLIIIILLNVIFGIIIDTFGELRSQKLERQRDTTETCFICGIDKQVFDRASDTNDGFKIHIKGEQNMWNYFYFILYIWEQDKDDDDGLEHFVRHCIEDNDIKWFPMNKAMSLNNVEDESDSLLNDIQNDFRSSESKVLAKIDHCNGEVNNILDRIMFSLAAEEKNRRESMSATSIGRSASMSRGQLSKDRGGSISSLKSRASTAPVKKPHVSEPEVLKQSESVSEVQSSRTPRNASYKILLLVMEINGLEMNTQELQSVFVRISSESGLRTIYAHSTTTSKVLFDRRDKTFVQVSSAAKVGEGRSCRIQIMQSAGRITNFLAKVDVAYADMIQSNNKEIVKYFTPVSHSSATECSIKMLVKIYEV